MVVGEGELRPPRAICRGSNVERRASPPPQDISGKSKSKGCLAEPDGLAFTFKQARAVPLSAWPPLPSAATQPSSPYVHTAAVGGRGPCHLDWRPAAAGGPTGGRAQAHLRAARRVLVAARSYLEPTSLLTIQDDTGSTGAGTGQVQLRKRTHPAVRISRSRACGSHHGAVMAMTPT